MSKLRLWSVCIPCGLSMLSLAAYGSGCTTGKTDMSWGTAGVARPLTTRSSLLVSMATDPRDGSIVTLSVNVSAPAYFAIHRFNP